MEFLHQELHDLERTVLEGARILMGAGQEDALRSLRRALETCKNRARDIITGRKPEEESP